MDLKEKEVNLEKKHQENVLKVMREICELTQEQDDVYNKYNDIAANNLLDLYVAIDKYNKSGEYFPLKKDKKDGKQ